VLHRWRIEPREYERLEFRRGRRHAYEDLDPARTALVVIDMVPFFLEDNAYARGVVPNITTLATALRAAGGTVAWVVSGTPPPSAARIEFLGPTITKLHDGATAGGPLRDRLWHEFAVEAEDILAEKTAVSAFFPGRSTLPPLLEERRIETVLITGTVANVCCESAARDASTLGYRVIMVADGNAALRDQDLNATLHTIYRTFGDVRPTGEVLELIRTGRSEGP
jgi:nicotinamidase-related amidase